VLLEVTEDETNVMTLLFYRNYDNKTCLIYCLGMNEDQVNNCRIAQSLDALLPALPVDLPLLIGVHQHLCSFTSSDQTLLETVKIFTKMR
jgi:hypothetical protein